MQKRKHETILGNGRQKPELIIHIGSPKTGSISLQSAFKNNRDFLSQEGIFYPMSFLTGGCYGWEISRLLLKESIENIVGAEGKNDIEIIRNAEEKSVNKIRKDFLKSGCNRMLMSNVGLFSLHCRDMQVANMHKKRTLYRWDELINEGTRYRATRLRYLFKGFNVKIVCYLRRQDLYIESIYNQACKEFGVKEVIDYVNLYNDICERPNDNFFPEAKNEMSSFFMFYQGYFAHTYYYNILSIWADVFGKANIIVKPFEKSQISGSLIDDFL